MSNNYYQQENLKNLYQIKNLAPEQLQAFSEFNSTVFKEGALTKKEKEIIAVAIAKNMYYLRGLYYNIVMKNTYLKQQTIPIM